MARDYYGILGVEHGADASEIKRAYRKLARELHPDVNPDAAAQERFREVSTAYEVLTDPEKRRIVDLGGDPLDPRGGAGGGAGGGDPFAGFGGFSDIMDAFFGGSAAGGRGRGPRSRVQPGADALIRMELTLEDCAAGIQRDLTVDTAVLCTLCQGSGCAEGTHPTACDTCGGSGEIQSVQRSFLGQVVTARPCPTCRGFGEVIPDPCRQCSGDGRVRSRRTVAVKIPAGVAEGMRVRLAGQGEIGAGGGPAGDLYVEVEEAPHEIFTRDGSDLHCTLPLPMTAAALGTTLPLTLLDGVVQELDIEAGTQHGTIRTLRGKGMPRLRSTGRVDGHGDLLVHVEVAVPARLDKEQTDLLRQLAKLRGEEQPDLVGGARNGHGLFSRLRDTWGR
ncbi:Chaperone protein DnaJ [Pseudonocardia sp. Ae168_Ps1]|uniref:molecular chaperone DnaJ n=1 Tax=unclassified Pseudonocardia TaxID=2619320 RepID=UPI0001FFEC9C|nr:MULTISPECIES: molecular chaperone DnaJ [unclassified Pseudonocardia]ALE72787.1 molecular chaperone DnaJ [Pseudonocardia sp. EC080625-04]ALL76107.1 molecular chaperone DnaJ [Pseudonocardia sp. EC080610-09]ALL83131.1 molecular chaperone DnaJ [Pseudonocardia sp. EC080619-01]OLL73157.1 Chaperone protein DnaJ [Pseudonocardia sp. Ae150A_Ps1]OLL79134.1 Chaperone protein DnaJ [Pseudonocardia sp. Ae168_Ps1]